MQWDLTVSLLGDSPKGSGSSLGTHREIAKRRSQNSSQECRRLPEWQDFSHHLLFSSPPLGKSCEIRLEEFRFKDPLCGYR
ncbi:hypothetical protein B296_00019416 [Ensete ventricosum]|uniref:Uncharacterized protein n=1 Tax=Ensete ventricosum TaxID=4639 RepID=A0A427AX92_ENSVE|nr:hypothetical protein B296_00019416 [Ensete ventricosum]